MKLTQKDAFVLASVEEATGLIDITQKTRKREYVDARRIAYIIFRNMHNKKYMDIAKIFDRNHATIIYGVESAKNLLETDQEFKDLYYESLAAVTGGGGRMCEIIQQIKELKAEFLTLQKVF
tara:strand:- start:7876 stop:8241 length:366 start_codon:yes stop_codon:yes gene_type:complete